MAFSLEDYLNGPQPISPAPDTGAASNTRTPFIDRTTPSSPNPVTIGGAPSPSNPNPWRPFGGSGAGANPFPNTASIYSPGEGDSGPIEQVPPQSEPPPEPSYPPPAPSAPAPPAPPVTTQPPPSDWQAWFMDLVHNLPVNQQSLLGLQSIFDQYGVKITPPNASGEQTKIGIPDGHGGFNWVRVGFGENRWMWVPQSPHEFDDPWGAGLEDAVNELIRRLGLDPSRPGLMELMRRLLGADQNNQANTQEFVGRLRTRRDELNAPPFSAGDEAVMRAKAFDQLERRRQQTLGNRRNELYARGFEPTSGLVTGAENDTNQQFEQARTGVESDLLASQMAEGQKRRNQAVGLDQIIQQALNGGDLQSLQYLTQNAGLEENLIQDPLDRLRQIIAAIGIPLDEQKSRQQFGLQTAGLGGNPQSIMASILGLLQYGNQSRQVNQTGNANNMQGIGQLISILFPQGQAH